nr:S-layer homology domain-containing protein [Microbacterium thalassium]
MIVAPAAQAQPAAASGSVVQTSLAGFSAGDIISDAVFFDDGAMTEAQIQKFLEAQVPTCRSGYTCLKDWYDTSRSTSADAMCGAYSGGSSERASRIIYKVAQACGINPRVILVTLQKEQGLVTHTWPSEWRYTIAMGQGCPDTAACDEKYYGFFNQVYGAAWQFKRYANPPGTSQYFTWYAPKNTWNVLYNPDRSCGSSPVYISNQATANLYYYTPYQPNAAALKAGYGEGDGCSAYGNRNFYNYFTDWFGSTQSAAPPATDTPFVDVSSEPSSPVFNTFASDIVWLADQGISEGWTVAGGWREFRPRMAVKRDVMAAFLYRMAGSPDFDVPRVSPFTDVSSAQPFYEEIAWLAASGISTGWTTSAGSREFRPNASVSREVMAAFLYRYAGEPEWTSPDESPFVDVDTNDTFYREISWLAGSGVSAGWSRTDGGREFRPTSVVNRDVMAAFLHRLYLLQNPFVDVSSDTESPVYSVFAADIAWLASEGISEGWTRGDGAREYRPTRPVLREAMAAFLYRLAGEPEFVAPAESPFVDVPVTWSFYREISWLAASGISEGWTLEDGTREFRPAESVRRDVMAAFLYRFAGSPEFDPPEASPFVDVPVSSPFYAEISWLAATGISTGWQRDDGLFEFRPTAAVNRDVMAAFLHRLDAVMAG